MAGHKLVTFFQTYPLEATVSDAIGLVKEKLHNAQEAFDKDCEHEGWVYLSDAHRMIAAIYAETGVYPEQYQ